MTFCTVNLKGEKPCRFHVRKDNRTIQNKSPEKLVAGETYCKLSVTYIEDTQYEILLSVCALTFASLLMYHQSDMDNQN